VAAQPRLDSRPRRPQDPLRRPIPRLTPTTTINQSPRPHTQKIGQSPAYTYADGKIVRSDQVLGGLDLGPGKPEHIFAQTGRLPAFAGGNADVDIEMLACAGFALLVNHDDAEREFAYTKAAEKSLATAEQLGWTVVSMKNDWTTVFKNDGAA